MNENDVKIKGLRLISTWVYILSVKNVLINGAPHGNHSKVIRQVRFVASLVFTSYSHITESPNHSNAHDESLPFFSSAIIPLHQYAYSPHSSRYISNDADKENLLINREPLEFAIIPSIFVTLMCASGVIL